MELRHKSSINYFCLGRANLMLCRRCDLYTVWLCHDHIKSLKVVPNRSCTIKTLSLGNLKYVQHIKYFTRKIFIYCLSNFIQCVKQSEELHATVKRSWHTVFVWHAKFFTNMFQLFFIEPEIFMTIKFSTTNKYASKSNYENLQKKISMQIWTEIFRSTS